jgi:DNA-directed RNA polymerase subunit L
MAALENPSTRDPGAKRLLFDVKGHDVAVVNALRRIILSDVESVAPRYNPMHPDDNDINIVLNNTVLHDQIMGQRISLIPIHLSATEVKAYEPSSFKFVINKSNTGKEPVDVTSADITVYTSEGSPLSDDARKAMFPPDPITGDYILLTKLKPMVSREGAVLRAGDTFRCEYVARRGCGRQSAHWCPVSACFYSNAVDEALAAQKLEEKLASADPAERKRVEEHHATIDRLQCCVPDAFRFAIESECGMSAHDIILEGLAILLDKVRMLRGRTKLVERNGAMFTASIGDENHTLGNMYQALSLRFFEKELDFLGYSMPHPLEETIVIKLQLTSRSEDEADFWAFVEKSSLEIEGYLDALRQDFERLFL